MDQKFKHPCKETCSGYKQGGEELLDEICDWLEDENGDYEEINAKCNADLVEMLRMKFGGK